MCVQRALAGWPFIFIAILIIIILPYSLTQFSDSRPIITHRRFAGGSAGAMLPLPPLLPLPLMPILLTLNPYPNFLTIPPLRIAPLGYLSHLSILLPLLQPRNLPLGALILLGLAFGLLLVDFRF